MLYCKTYFKKRFLTHILVILLCFFAIFLLSVKKTRLLLWPTCKRFVDISECRAHFLELNGLLDLWPRPEGSYKTGSVPPFFCLSFCMSVNFSELAH